MASDTRSRANRIINGLQKKGLISHWTRMDIESARQTILKHIDVDQPSFGELALALTNEQPKNAWPRDYQEQFWALYPRRVSKNDAMRRLDKIRKDGKIPFEAIITAVEIYRNETRNEPIRYVALPATWLNKGRWADDKDAIVGNSRDGRGEVKNGFLGRLMEP